MASTDAIINLIVNGQQRVERIISRTNQLNDLIQSINRSPLDFTIGQGSQNQRNLTQLETRLRGTRTAINNTAASIRQADAAMGGFGAAASQARADLQSLSLGTVAYSRATRRLRDAESGFERQRQVIADLGASLDQLQRRERAEFRQVRRAEAFQAQIRFANQLADTYLDVGTAARRLSGEIGNISSGRSRAVLQSEIQFFDALASNVDIASASYRRFTAASGAASVAAGEASRRRFRILAETFDPEVRATSAQGRIPSSSSRTTQSQAAQEIQSLINAFPEVARSRAGLEDYKGQLQSVLDLIPAGTTRFIQLSSAIREVDNELARFETTSGRQFGPSQFITTPRSGPASDTLNSLKKRQEYADNVNKEYQKQEDLVFKINDSLLDASRKESLSLQVNRALDALMENRLETAQAITQEVNRQFNIETRIAKQRPAEVQTTPKGLAVELGGGAQLRETLKTSEFIAKAQKDIADATELAANAGQRLVGLENSQALRAGLDDYLSGLQNVEDAAGRVLSTQKAAIRDFDRRLKESVAASKASKKEVVDEADARAQIATRINQVQKLQNDYVSLEGQGVRFLQERADLQALVNRLAQNSVAPTKENSKALQQQLDYYRSLLALRTSEAKLAGTFSGRTKETTPEKAESLRKRLLGSALGVQSQFISLESRGAEVANEKLKIEQTILDIKNLQNRATQGQLELLAQQILDLKNIGKETSNLTPRGGGGKKDATPGAGLEEALKSLRQARQAREQFLGSTSPAEAIDKIVREFNTGKPEAGSAGKNVAQTFASNLRKGIPDAIAASAALAGASIDAIKKKLEMRSPSRVMIEIARNLVDTYVSVLQAAIPEIQQASQRAFAAPTNLDVVNTTSFPLPKSESNISALAQFVASFVDPMQSRGFNEFQAFDLVVQKGRRLEPRNIPGIDYSAAEDAAVRGRYGDPEFQKVRKAYVEFYNIPKEFAPDIERASNAAGQASEDAKRLEAEVTGLVSGLEQISNLLRGTADLVRVPSTAAEQAALPVQQKAAIDFVGDYWSNAAVDAKELDERLKREFSGPGATGLMAMVDFWDTSFDQAQRIAKQADEAAAEAQKAKQQVAESFAPSVQKAEQLDEAHRRQAIFDAFAVARQQAETDARAASEAIASQIVEPVKKSGPQGERKIQAAISSLFDRVSEIFKGIGGFGGRGGAGGGGGRGGAGGGGAGGGGDFGRRFEQAVAQGPEALLGLRELAQPATASIRELEALSAVLKEFRAVLDPTVEGFDRLERQLRETAANLDRQLERRSPDADFLTRTFGARGGRAVSEGLIGGAFPLLFGQGIGAAALGGLGGAAGGFAGGGLGFGLSLVGTALGTAFDEAVQGATELGDALNDTSATFDKVKEKALFSSKETEKFVDKLQEAGLVASAATLSQQEIVDKIGKTGVQSLQRLSDSSDRLNRAWSELNLQLQAALAGPMAGLLEWVSRVLNIAAQEPRSRAAVADVGAGLSGAKKEEFQQRRLDIEMRRGGIAASILNDTGISGLLRGIGINIGISPEEANALRGDLVEEFKDFAVPVEIKAAADEKQKLEEELALLTKRLEVTDIGKSLIDQYRSVQREQKDLDKQRADLVRSYEESIGDIRKKVEDEVASRRFSILEKENQLLDQQGQNRLKQLQLANQELIAGAGRGERPEIEQAARNAAEIVARFTEDQLSAEQEAAKIKRDAALDSLKFDYQAAEFKASIEKEVSRLNIETARRVADINEQVRRRNEEFDNRRFAIEKEIADLQLRSLQVEVGAAARDPSLPKEARDEARQLYEIIGAQRAEVEKLSSPPALRGVGQVGGGGVSTQSIDAVVAKEKAAIAAIVQAALQGADLLKQEGIDKFKNSINDLITGIEAPINAINQSILDADQERVRYSELISRGLTDTVAQRVIEIEKARDLAVAQLDSVINELEKRKAVEGTTEAITRQIDEIKRRKKALEEAAGTAPADGKPGTGLIGRAVESEKGRKIQDFINSAQEGLNDLESVAIRVSQGIGDAVGNSIASGISGLIEGTATAKEVFADFLKDVGQILVQEGAKMIATYVAIGIARIFAGLQASTTSATGPNPGGIPSTGNVTAPSVDGFDTGSIANIAANGAYFDGGMAYFANGGIVSSPTLFQFADGGVPRNGLMGEAGPEAIMPLKRGADGRLGVSALDLPFQKRDNEMSPEAGDAFSELQSASVPFTKTTERLMTERSERETVAAINNPKPLDVRFESQVINGVEYVTAEQHQKGMAQAAERGRALTLAALQNSVKTRKKVGI